MTFSAYIKYIPNAISLSRFFMCAALFFMTNKPAIFLIIYLFCGLSDVVDGYLAHKFKMESALGAKLDTLGDVALCSVIIFLLLSYTSVFNEVPILILLLGIVVIKLINLCLTKYKFGLWGILHTVAYKIVGFLLYISFPFTYFCNNLSVVLILIICISALLATMEETIIILKEKEYNINKKGYFDKA